MINIGLLGLGTVGTGVVEILNKRRQELKDLLGREILVKRILVRNMDRERGVDLGASILTTNFQDLVEDDEIDILIEVTGDLEKSYEYIIDGLRAGKNIVTANKAVVSKHLEEFSALADEKNLAFLYESSVGGGIPVIKALREETRLNEIKRVQGILNGTCNYILTRMMDEEKDYGEILEIAQELGYAEADPTDDVEGNDSLRKLRILGSLALKANILEEDILLDGISRISSQDIGHIKNMDSKLRLIGEVNLLEDGFTAIVQPTIVANDDYFASVNLAYNSVAFEGDNVGELKFYGPGAGKLPTANAVLADILDIIMENHSKRSPLGRRELVNHNDRIRGDYYLRVAGGDEDLEKEMEHLFSQVLSREEGLVVLIEDGRLKEIKDLLERLSIEKEDCFLARILK